MTDIDCLIIGAGPAGLTAAIYAARFRLSVLVIDAGASRAALIPCTRNHAGFPDGISGVELLQRMRRQADKFGVAFLSGTVSSLTHVQSGFLASGDFTAQTARAVLLATGVTNRRPNMDDRVHDEALANGQVRYCPVCDGFEVIDQDVAVIGTGDHGVCEAAFLRSYTSRVTLVAPNERHDLAPADRQRLEKLGVRCCDGPAREFALKAGKMILTHAEGRQAFDAVYPALGSEIHSGLAGQLGADRTSEGCVRVDAHQRTSVPMLYAAGDVVVGLDQISHAMGEAGVAATTLRNDLASAREHQLEGR